MYLMYYNTIIGTIDQNGLEIINRNRMVDIVFPSKKTVSLGELQQFLADRIVSPHRRDIERILNKLGLKEYSVFKIAEKTRAFNLSDKFWIAMSGNEVYEEVFKKTFEELFSGSYNHMLESASSPSGVNQKNYYIDMGSIGIEKKRLSPMQSDAEMEVAVYRLANKMGVKCCEAYMLTKDTVFSRYQYNFNNEAVIHVRKLIPESFEEQERYSMLKQMFSALLEDIQRMIVLDFVTRQDDRHLSNMAIKTNGYYMHWYDLYDNGRSLFFEDTEEMINESLTDVVNGCTTFGNVGTYYDAVCGVVKDVKLSNIMNLNVSDVEIEKCFEGLNIPEFRKQGAIQWIKKTLRVCKLLDVDKNIEFEKSKSF